MYAQYLTDKTVPLDAVQVTMGHNNPNTTFRDYAGIRPERVSGPVFEKLSNFEENEQKRRSAEENA